MRVLILEVLTGLLLVLLPVPGAFFGYVIGAFLRLDDRAVFWLMNTGAILLVPTLIMTPAGVSPAPAGFVLAQGLFGTSGLSDVVLSCASMIALTFVNIRISEYLKP